MTDFLNDEALVGRLAEQIREEVERPDATYGTVAVRLLDRVEEFDDPDGAYEFLAFIGGLSLAERFFGSAPRDRRYEGSRNGRRRGCSE